MPGPLQLFLGLPPPACPTLQVLPHPPPEQLEFSFPMPAARDPSLVKPGVASLPSLLAEAWTTRCPDPPSLPLQGPFPPSEVFPRMLWSHGAVCNSFPKHCILRSASWPQVRLFPLPGTAVLTGWAGDPRGSIGVSQGSLRSSFFLLLMYVEPDVFPIDISQNHISQQIDHRAR